MNIAVIQDQAVFKYDNKYYRKSLTEFDKYLKLCDHLFYCCSIKSIESSLALEMKLIDLSRVTIIELKKERLFVSKINKNIIQNIIFNVDLVFVKMPSLTLGRYALHLLQKKQIKYVTEVVGCAFDVFWYYGLKGKILALPNYLVAWYYIKKSKSVIYVTNRFLQKRYPTKGFCLSCSNVRIDVVDNILNRNSYQQGDILKIGTISPVDRTFRGQITVLKAMNLLKGRGIIVKYFLVGGGRSDRLQKIASALSIQDQVFFLGELTHDKVISFLDTIDVYVHPSKAEGLPRALIEAMSRGRLAIGAKTGGIPELLPSEYIFEKGDYRKLSNIVEHLSVQDFETQGRVNYLVSQQYRMSILDDKRVNFINKIMRL